MNNQAKAANLLHVRTQMEPTLANLDHGGRQPAKPTINAQRVVPVLSRTG